MNCSKTSLLKRVFCFALALILCAGAFLIAPTEASAAAEGTMMSNAINAVFDKTYVKCWTSGYDHLNHYVKITVPQQGIVTITATKPYDDEGEYGYLEFTLHDEYGDPIWGNETFYASEDAKSEYRIKVGLAAGTYYLTLQPGFYVTSGLIETYYSISFKADAFCEIEPNGSGYQATNVTLGQKYTGWFGPDGSDYEESDYFKLPVAAGHTYRIVWYNFSATDRTSTMIYLLMPDGESDGVGYSFGDAVNAEGLNYADVEIAQSGTAYLRLDNFSGLQYEYGFVITDLTCEQEGHEYGSWKTTTKATCEHTGVKTRTCVGCGHQQTKTIAKTSHSYSSWKTTRKATCEKTGVKSRTCKYCGDKQTKTIAKTEHDFGAWKTTKKATCTKDGVKTRTCADCGTKQTKKITKGHTYTNNADTTCNKCGKKGYPGGNTLYKIDGKLHHIVDRKVVKDTTLVKYNGKWYYVKNGVVNNSNTMVEYNGKWYHVKNGKLAKDTTLVKYNGTWYYVKNGVKNNANTLVKYNGKWYHVKDGKFVKDTTLVKYNGTWYYVKNGVKSNANTLVKYNGKWYHVKDGKFVKDTTLVKYNGTWYYVKNGIKNNANTLVKYNGKWYHVDDGKFVKDTTLVKYNGKWYYIKNGLINTSFTGTIYFNGKYYNVQKGVIV